MSVFVYLFVHLFIGWFTDVLKYCSVSTESSCDDWDGDYAVSDDDDDDDDDDDYDNHDCGDAVCSIRHSWTRWHRPALHWRNPKNSSRYMNRA